jgi:hypothetical protein
MTGAAWAGIIALLLVAYFLASGAAFVAIYKFPNTAPRRTFRLIFLPLEWLASRNRFFGRAYNSFHTWCYARFVEEAR